MSFKVAPCKACVFVEMSGSLMVSALDSRLKKSGFELCSGSMSNMFSGNMIHSPSVSSVRVALHWTKVAITVQIRKD